MRTNFFVLIIVIVLSNIAWSQTPDWSFAPSGSQDRLFTSLSPWNADLDGKVELAACTYYYDINNPNESGGYVFLLTINQLGNLVKDCGWISTYRACYQCLKWADINGDGNSDLVVGTSLMTDENTPVLYFPNHGNALSTTPIPLVSNKAWDVLSLEWGDFNFDYLPDLLIVRTDGPPMLLAGQASGSDSWTILGATPIELCLNPSIVLPQVVSTAMETDIWDVNSDGFLDIVFSAPYATCELVSAPGLLCYTIEDPIGRGYLFSEAVAYVPDLTSDNRVSILRGNAWDQGVAGVYDFSTEADLWTELLPDDENFNNEYVSDFALVSIVGDFQSKLFLAIAEAGYQEPSMPNDDPRFRHGRILKLNQVLLGWEAVDVWKENDEGRPEAFSACWCNLSSSTSQSVDISLVGSDHLFSLGGNDQYACHRPVYKIIQAYYTDGLSTVPMHCWYSGNGWFGIRETIPTNSIPHVIIQTTTQPDVYFGRRGSVEGFNR